ncbi:MAG: TonB-dependent receptor domain-containing protein [Limisphaerales bacterium]
MLKLTSSGSALRFLLFACAILFAPCLRSQPASSDSGTISGLVLDNWTEQPLSGVIATVRGTTLATTTSADGRYQIKGVAPGQQTVVFSKSGYARAIVTEIRVASAQTSRADLAMRPEFFEMDEFEITAEQANDQVEQLFFDRQSARSMTDAIGSDMFKNLAVGDAAQALTKVTGATVADGKFAVIRGLADRYTFTTLNGLELPSADPDRKAFQLDLMPSKFIEKMDVYKTFTPDMSGGFAGGSIDIVTRDYPDDFVFELRASTAYNTQSSLRDDFPSSDRGSRDWLAMDDGGREIPPEIAAQDPSGGANYPPEAKSSFESSQFAPVGRRSPLDTGFDLLFGNTHKLFDRRIGYLAGINFKNEYRMYDNGIVRSYDQGGRVVSIDKTEVVSTFEAQWGALANLSLELSEGHDLQFNFVRVQSAQDETRRARGQDGDVTSIEDGTYVDQSILNWTERTLTYYQLGGAHTIPELNNIEFDWGAALSTTTQEDPDFRIFQYFADPANDYYSADISSAQPNFPARFWRDLEENGKVFRGDFTIPIPSYNDKDNFIKTGAALNLSERDYFQRGIFATRTGNHPFEESGEPNDWMAEENLSNINLRNFPANLTYQGEQTVTAGYLMTDWAAFNWLRLIGGARFESSEITIDTFNLTQNQPLTPGLIKQDDWLPSLGATFQIRTNLDLRLAWSRTVVRPTYREIAEVPIYDVTRNRTFFGNPGLQMSASENFDLRASWYPRPGEIISVSVFAKRIDRPIELSATRTDNTLISYENFDQAIVQGVEGEIRFRLDRIWGPLDDLFLGFNGAYITSEVQLTDVQKLNRQTYGETATDRPLYDQPEYILNGSLTWEFEPTRTTFTLSGGVVGRSLVIVGLAKPDEYILPAPDLNLFVRQRLGKNWDVRFTAKNLLDPEFQIGQTWPETGEVVLESYTKGITFGLSVGCEF